MNYPIRYLLDSDILVEFLRGREKAMRYLNDLDGDLLVSVITIAELTAGARNDTEEQVLNEFLSPLAAIPVDRTIAERGGRYRQQYKHSHGTGLDDALIAATAEVMQLRLVTFNQRHFPMISNLLVPYER